MPDRNLAVLHPGFILLHQYLQPRGLTPYRLSKSIGLSQTHLSKVIRGKSAISADMALRLARFFGNSPVFWMDLQSSYDLSQQEKILNTILLKIVPFDDIADEFLETESDENSRLSQLLRNDSLKFMKWMYQKTDHQVLRAFIHSASDDGESRMKEFWITILGES